MQPFIFLPPASKSLRAPSEALDPSVITTPEFQFFLDQLILTMQTADGVGVAAPQIGKNIRAIVVNQTDGPTCYLNPEIIRASPATCESEEGCFSVPDTYGIVMRHKKIRLRALNRHGRRLEVEVKNFPAFVFQHEIDHLDGILFIDKAIRLSPKA